MMRAACAAIVHGGFEVFLRGLFPASPLPIFKDKLFSDLQQRAEEYYRGEVWPLRHAFGMLSRFVNGTADEGGKIMTPAVVTTWVSEGGFVSCSCVGRSSHVARLRSSGRARVFPAAGAVSSDGARAAAGAGAAREPTPADHIADADCAHARTLSSTIERLCRRLGVSDEHFRSVAATVFEQCDPADAAVLGGRGGDVDVPEDWDAEGPLETFQTGQSVVAVVVSGLGRCKVAAPVRCTRHTTSCSFCNNAAGFSCMHAVRCRSVRRRAVVGARDAEAVRLEDFCVDGARSRLPLPMYNCKKAVLVNLDVCTLMREGKPLVVEAPKACSKCKMVKGGATDLDVETGVVMCSAGYCEMQLQSWTCQNKECNSRVFPDGREAGIVLLSSSTAATSKIMRDMATAMTTSGSTFGACHKRWHADYAETRDSGRYPSMAKIPTRSRQTITTLFWWTLHLMTKDPPLWAFKCGTCQDKDGRFRVLTADGIWMGYLKRLASGRYINPCEDCKSVKAAVEAASLHPSEWVRRYVRSVLKQPTKAVVIKAGYLRSAQRAMAFLCPDALPNVSEPGLLPDRVLALVRLRKLLDAIWNLEQATMNLCDAIITHVKKLIAPNNNLPASVVVVHRGTLQDLAAWKARVSGRPVALPQDEADQNVGAPPAAAAADGGGGAVVNGDDGAAGAHAVVAVDLGDGGGGGNGGDGAAGAHAVVAVDVGDGGSGNGGGVAAANAAAGGQGADVRGGVANEGNAAAGADVRWRGRVVADGAAAGAGGGRARADGHGRRPAANARAHHYDRTTNEPGDPRCLRASIKDLGVTGYKDVTSFCVAIAIDPVVNGFKPQHGAALTGLSNVLLEAEDAIAAGRLDTLIAFCAGGEEALGAVADDDVSTAEMLSDNRMLLSFLTAVSSSTTLFKRVRVVIADLLLSVRATVENYHIPREGTDGSARRYHVKWGDHRLSPAELRARFVAAYPDTPEEPQVTGAFFPGLLRCRPNAFSVTEEEELGTCAKHYKEVHKFYSPGTFTICCACAHPKMIGFVVLDKREGPPALLNTILSYFALLPTFLVYDFGCGALRSALGKLGFFCALVVLVSDLFHIVNHLCSDALHPRSYAGLDSANTVAHEQRNSPINLMRRSLRACGQQEYMSMLQVENIFYNVMAQAKGTSPYPLQEEYNYGQFFFSRTPCCCGCGYAPPAPDLPPPPAAPATAAPAVFRAAGEDVPVWQEGDPW